MIVRQRAFTFEGQGPCTCAYSDLGHVADVAEPIARFGAEGGLEAATRANRSRDIGNHLHLCRCVRSGG